MLTPGLRLFILPLGAVSMIATLSSQNAPRPPQRESMIEQMRQEIAACTPNPIADICVIGKKVAR
jgi:hypothetical protein